MWFQKSVVFLDQQEVKSTSCNNNKISKALCFSTLAVGFYLDFDVLNGSPGTAEYPDDIVHGIGHNQCDIPP